MQYDYLINELPWLYVDSTSVTTEKRLANLIVYMPAVKDSIERLKLSGAIRSGDVSIIAKDNVFTVETVIEEYGHIEKCNVSYGVDII